MCQKLISLLHANLFFSFFKSFPATTEIDAQKRATEAKKKRETAIVSLNERERERERRRRDSARRREERSVKREEEFFLSSQKNKFSK